MILYLQLRFFLTEIQSHNNDNEDGIFINSGLAKAINSQTDLSGLLYNNAVYKLNGKSK